MRKLIIAPVKKDAIVPRESWLNLEDIASVQMTSEEAGFPIESAFNLESDGRGWRAGQSGTQTIRLIFDQPQQIKRIWLLFEERDRERTQEFVLRWTSENDRAFREIVRQQWNFSPAHSTSEIENYTVQLSNLTILELVIVPHNRGGEARASIQKLLLA